MDLESAGLLAKIREPSRVAEDIPWKICEKSWWFAIKEDMDRTTVKDERVSSMGLKRV